MDFDTEMGYQEGLGPMISYKNYDIVWYIIDFGH